MQPSTQAEIIRHLNIFPGSTARDLSTHLHVSRADIHYHIKKLLKEGIIEAIPGLEENYRAGRPASGYRISPTNQNDNLSGLLEMILGVHPDLLEQHNLFKLSELLVKKFCRPSSPSLRILAEQIMQFLTPLNYRPHWEAALGGPRIYFENCPYASVLPGHPQLCQLDSEILRNLFGFPVLMLQTRGKNPTKTRKCIFQVNL